MKLTVTGKCCGTCQYWDPGEGDPKARDSYCTWGHDYPPSLPFWATINNGDHRDHTLAEQGKNCQTWIEKGDK